VVTSTLDLHDISIVDPIAVTQAPLPASQLRPLVHLSGRASRAFRAAVRLFEFSGERTCAAA
jgi:hypothetical protein